LVLEDPAVGGAGQEPHPRVDHRLVAEPAALVGTGCKARDEAVEVALAVLAQLHGDRDGLAEQRLGLDVALRADEVEADLAELAEAAGRRHRLEQQVGWRQRRSELDRRRRHGESSTLRRSGRASDRSLPPLPRQATKVTRARVAAVHGQRPPASALSRSHATTPTSSLSRLATCPVQTSSRTRASTVFTSTPPRRRPSSWSSKTL